MTKGITNYFYYFFRYYKNIIREYFARFGICRTFVTDNGPQWTSKEFKIFVKNNNIKHISTPYLTSQTNYKDGKTGKYQYKLT